MIIRIILIVLSFCLSSKYIYSQVLPKEIKFSEHKPTPFYGLKKIRNTEIFQGNKETKNYFEGWYFKMASADGLSVLSIIPGISLSEDGSNQHAFIQVIDGNTATTEYYEFPIESFSFSKKEFAINIGENYFSENKIILNIEDSNGSINGTVEMNNITKYVKKKAFKNNIMGWYRFVPYMECYHGVLSINHDLNGSITTHENSYNFSNGKGYIEKDWGSSMPSAWVWIQSNSFNTDKTSIMLSVANVPWRKKSFVGFLGFVLFEDKVYHFATYDNAKFNLEFIDENSLNINIKKGKYIFQLQAKRNNSGMLLAPTSGSMDRRIPESIDADLKISIFNRKGDLLYIDSTKITGLELVGAYQELGGSLK